MLSLMRKKKSCHVKVLGFTLCTMQHLRAYSDISVQTELVSSTHGFRFVPQNSLLLLPKLFFGRHLNVDVLCMWLCIYSFPYDNVQLSRTSHTHTHTHKYRLHCLCPQTLGQTHKHRDHPTNSNHRGETSRPYGWEQSRAEVWQAGANAP